MVRVKFQRNCINLHGAFKVILLAVGVTEVIVHFCLAAVVLDGLFVLLDSVFKFFGKEVRVGNAKPQYSLALAVTCSNVDRLLEVANGFFRLVSIIVSLPKANHCFSVLLIKSQSALEVT